MKRFLFLLAMFASSATGATFLVPSDEMLVRASRAIVVATAGGSYCRYAPGGWIETVTQMRIDEAIKGAVRTGDTIQVTELGGMVDGIYYVVPGSPQYANGERMLLFLETNDRGEWVAKNMVVGKFAFNDGYLVRDASELGGREPLRDEQRFLRFVRDVAAGREAHVDYIVPDRVAAERVIVPEAAPASTYCMVLSGLPARWNGFPSAVTFRSNGTQPGAPGGGLTAVQHAFAAWDSAPGATVRYQYGGITSVQQAFNSSDGVNSIQFNDPSGEIPGSFQLVGGATLAIGGFWAGGTHTFAGETFLTITEADLVIQDGIDTGGGHAGLIGRGFDHVVTHELGHTLGIRHSDQPPPGGTSTGNAIMNSFVDFNNDSMGSTLQPWDIEAIDAVYGSGGIVTPPCNPPVINAQPQSVSIINTAANLNVSASGDPPLQYQWFTGATGNTSQPIQNANAALLTVQPRVTTNYWVRVTNTCGSANSDTATVTVNGCPAVTINSTTGGTLIIEGRTVTLTADAVGGSGLTYQWFTGNPGNTGAPAGSGPSVTVRPAVTTNYWVRVTNSCGGFADSDVIVITVQPCKSPLVVIQPASSDVLTGTSAVLFVGDTGTKPENYQWFEGPEGDDSRPVTTATFPSFTTPALFTSTSYWVRITNDCGEAQSHSAQLTVVPSCRGAAIAAQPADETVNPGASATLSVAATGTSLTYEWYQGPQLDFSHRVGGSSPTFITPPVTVPMQFWVRVTSPCGNAQTATINVSPASAPRRRPAR